MGLEIGSVFNINIDFVFLEVSQVFHHSFFLSLHLMSHSPETLSSIFISINIQSSGFSYLCLKLGLQMIQMSEFIITVAVVTLLVLRLLLDFDARVSQKSKVWMMARRHRGRTFHVLGVLTCAPPIADVLLN